MPRPLRHVQPGIVYELTHRTRHGRFAFAPTRQLRAELIGVLADAQQRWPQVEVHELEFMSNHCHGLLSLRGPNAANAMAEWSCYVFGQAARVAQAVHGLTGEIWESARYRLIPILDDAVLRARARYVMAQAVAANLVARPSHWPGVSTCDAVCRGAALIGYRPNAALRRRAAREGVPLAKLAPRRVFEISPLPTQRDWPAHRRAAWFRAIEREIIDEAAAANPGRRYAHPEALRTVSPHRTVELIRRTAPRCHVSAGNLTARRTWRAAVRAFTDAWRAALAAWVDGARACFPVGGWVPFGACYAPGYVQRE